MSADEKNLLLDRFEHVGVPDDVSATIHDPNLVKHIEAYCLALEQGRKPQRDELLAMFPDAAQDLCECLDALELVHQVVPEARQQIMGSEEGRPGSTGLQFLGQLGDYRMIREIGRGGMGVVYEAEQISLKRRVALKVLPFAAMLDQRQLQRFKNEAQASASLKHQNIVQIFSVGCERAVHFYAMDYIEGRTLSQVIGELRQDAGLVPKAEQVDQLASGGEKASSDDPTIEFDATPGPPSSPSADTDHQTRAQISTEGDPRAPEFFRSVAKLGIQAAEALDHAHEMGVVHRDVKPSNLMVDASGHLWVTDFGLAMTQSEGNLTITGDVLGTLRYMSPEQASGKSRALDHHTDIYSLGVTLYELTTLRPAFGGDNRQKLLQEVTEEEPSRPRQINGAIPADLETIILKAMTKEPEARYSTAQELADDLRRFLEDKPIQARRPSLVERTSKWSRRHRPVVWTAIILLAFAAVAAAAGAWNGHQRRVQLERDLAENLAAARSLMASEDLMAAEQKLDEAQSLLDASLDPAKPFIAAVAELSTEVTARTRALKRFHEFQEFRQRVHSDMFHPSNAVLDRAMESCRAALDLYGALEHDQWNPREAFEDLAPERQSRLEGDIAELLYVWARLQVQAAGRRDETDSLSKAHA